MCPLSIWWDRSLALMLKSKLAPVGMVDPYLVLISWCIKNKLIAVIIAKHKIISIINCVSVWWVGFHCDCIISGVYLNDCVGSCCL